MDKKQQQLITYYYTKFTERTFDEKDLYSFLMIVKKDAHDNKVIQELSDFLLHRENNTGYVKDYLEECKHIITNLEKLKSRKKIEDLFSFKDIRTGFNTLLVNYGFNKLSNEIINDFILCIISLLQSVALVSGKLNKEVGHLSFAASSKEVFLMGNMKTLSKGRYIPVTFPVLSVKNIYEKITPQDSNDTPYLFNDSLIEVVNIDGRLVITFPEIEIK
ncbi:hypothetical protein [Sporosarcina sp. YIM B06819]|uniref:hypothetical protein n=1 Tax=Sporosarcina sp. YIM B06819 TaxID=3081769 RepID=UPI00298C167E|nr:hypothetical protein [Sporosarcina sp. YIM B06819]